jgi:hypothetical protein
LRLIEQDAKADQADGDTRTDAPGAVTLSLATRAASALSAERQFTEKYQTNPLPQFEPTMKKGLLFAPLVLLAVVALGADLPVVPGVLAGSTRDS